jgi:hypothetical protein
MKPSRVKFASSVEESDEWLVAATEGAATKAVDARFLDRRAWSRVGCESSSNELLELIQA